MDEEAAVETPIIDSWTAIGLFSVALQDINDSLREEYADADGFEMVDVVDMTMKLAFLLVTEAPEWFGPVARAYFAEVSKNYVSQEEAAAANRAYAAELISRTMGFAALFRLDHSECGSEGCKHECARDGDAD